VEAVTGTGLSILPKATTSVDSPSLIAVGQRWVKSQLVEVEEKARLFNQTEAGRVVTRTVGRGKYQRTTTTVRKPRPLPSTLYHVLEDGSRTVPISDVPMRVAASNLSWDLYFRPLKEPLKTPSVRVSSQMLDRKLRKAPHVSVDSLRRSYKTVHAKLEGMAKTRVRPEFIPEPEAPRSYGLEQSPLRVRRGFRTVRIA